MGFGVELERIEAGGDDRSGSDLNGLDMLGGANRKDDSTVESRVRGMIFRDGRPGRPHRVLYHDAQQRAPEPRPSSSRETKAQILFPTGSPSSIQFLLTVLS